MASPANIFLVGPMGAGKTTIGRELSRVLGYSFRDTDREIEERTGADIPLIFELEGEEGFRRRESKVLDELTGLQGIVLATGGGAILDPENRKRLVARGKVVYLHTSVAQQLKRAGRDRNRPLLQTEDPRRRLQELMTEREPFYREVADLVVQTNGRSVKQVVRELQQKLAE